MVKVLERAAGRNGVGRSNGHANGHPTEQVLLLDPREIVADARMNGRAGEHSAKSVADLAESMKKDGQLQPIVVRKRNGKVFVVAGFRRLAAAMLLVKKDRTFRIRATLIETDDAGAFRRNIVENLERKTCSPLDIATAMDVLIRDYEWSMAQVARLFRVGDTYVRQMRRLLELPEGVRDEVHAGTLNTGAAMALLGVPPEEALAITRAFPPVPGECQNKANKGNTRSAKIRVTALRAAGKPIKPSLTQLNEMLETVRSKCRRSSIPYQATDIMLRYVNGEMGADQAKVALTELFRE